MRAWPQELENYVREIRKQMDENTTERSTLLNVQRQMRSDMSKLNDEMNEAKEDASNARRELSLCQTKLRVTFIFTPPHSWTSRASESQTNPAYNVFMASIPSSISWHAHWHGS